MASPAIMKNETVGCVASNASCMILTKAGEPFSKCLNGSSEVKKKVHEGREEYFNPGRVKNE